MGPLNPAFRNFPEEERLIGRMVIAYGEFEIMLAMCVADSLETEPNDIYRAFFRVFSPGSRVALADALLKTPTQKLGLTDARVQIKIAVKHCMQIRNQYAHALWMNIGPQICFLDVEEAARADEGFTMPKRLLDLALITKQHEYFSNCRDWLLYLEYEIKWRKAQGKVPHDPLRWPKPPKLPKPNLYNSPAGDLPPAGGDASVPI